MLPAVGPSSSTALRLRLAQDAARLGYWDYDPAAGRVEWDAACAALFGIALEDFEGTIEGFDKRCHPGDLDRVHAALAGTTAAAPLDVSFRGLLPDGGVRHLLSRGQSVAADDLGQASRLVGVILDVTDLHAALEGERQSAERLSRLASVALAMAGAQTEDDLARVVIDLGAEVLGADGGAVCVRDDEQGVLRLAVTEGLGVAVARKYAELPLDGPLPAVYTARTGEPLFLPDRAAGLGFTTEMETVYAETGRDAWAVLPLRSAGRLIGSLAVSWADPRCFSAEERELVEAFAAQTAQALARIQSLQAEHRLAEEARRLAETFQRSLLTSPPQPDHLQVAVRYAPAAEEAAVGGDWYDAFVVPDGSLCLVIGDCVGHDRQAAAAMATMRNLLRATAYAIEEPPAAVLTALDRAVRGLGVDVLATALLARVESLEPPESGGDGSRWRLQWSSAGHLPPVLHRPGVATELLVSPPDLLLGFAPEAPRRDSDCALPEGSTVLLYTDGLVERRGENLDEGLERLRRLVEELGHLPLEDLCDAVLAGLLQGDAEDDVALLAFRLGAIDSGRVAP